MKTNKIHWTEVIKLLSNGKKIKQLEINYNNEQIHWSDVQKLNKFGYRVPQNLIDYDDDDTNFTDIPELNEETLKNGTYREIIQVSCDYEISNWLKKSKINYNLLINNFLKSVYMSVKSV